MGVRFPSVAASVSSNPLPASAAETVICTISNLNLSVDGAQVLLFWFADILAGTSTTALVFRLRRGSTVAGAFVGNNPWTHTLAAGNSAAVSGWFPDSPGIVAEQGYVLTCSQTAATVAGTINDVSLIAMVL